jgi:penicillin-binding protein 1A
MGIIENSPKIDAMAVKPSIYPSIIYYADGTESSRLKGEENREYVTLDKIPQYLKDAFVAIEDERFYSHNGIDLRALARAFYITLTTDRTEGASTITQQLIKNNVVKIAKNSFVTKLQEQYMAVEYEKRLATELKSKKAAKDYILELYLNSINMHYSLNGVQTASEYYFDKQVTDLTLSECAVIAAITQNPSKNAPIMNPENNRHRQELVLAKMLSLGMITQDEYDEAYGDDVYARVSSKVKIEMENNSVFSYFNDALLNQLVLDLQTKYNIGETEAFNWAYNSGLQIYGTQDKAAQDIMDASFADERFFPKKDFEIDVQYTASIRNNVTGKTEHKYEEDTVKSFDGIEALTDTFKARMLGANDEIIDEKILPVIQPQAAMVVIDYHNGYVKALTGGRGEKMVNLALNRAVESERQPGSVFKILASYAPSIDLGVTTPATLIEDSPFEHNGYRPENWNHRYLGYVTARQGVRDSMNVVTVKNMYKTGVEECFKYLLNFGFTTLVGDLDENGNTDKGLATCLGGLTNGVTQMELCAAYGSIANQGVYNRPVLYTKVLDHDGNLLLENKPDNREVLKKQSAYVLTDMMEDVITAGTGVKARFKNVKIPIAGKTGTTTDTKDLTFVGYTPYYVASIWLGFDHPKTITQDEGYHMTLWSDVMEKIHADLPVKTFENPEGMVTATICGISGKLAVKGLCDHDPRGNMTRTDLFISGSQPTDYCGLHVSATIDTSTNMKAGPNCPEEYVKTVIGVLDDSPNAFTSDGVRYKIPSAWIDGPVCTLHHGHGQSSSYRAPEGGIILPDLEPISILPEDVSERSSTGSGRHVSSDDLPTEGSPTEDTPLGDPPRREEELTPVPDYVPNTNQPYPEEHIVIPGYGDPVADYPSSYDGFNY